MSNWHRIVDEYDTEQGVHGLFIELHLDGFLKKDITDDLLFYIIDKFSNNFSENKKNKLITYMLGIIECCLDFHIKEKYEPKKVVKREIIPESPKSVDDLKPEDFKDKEINLELIKKNGWEHPDE